MDRPKPALGSAAQLHDGKGGVLLSLDRIGLGLAAATRRTISGHMTGIQERSTRVATTEGRGV